MIIEFLKGFCCQEGKWDESFKIGFWVGHEAQIKQALKKLPLHTGLKVVAQKNYVEFIEIIWDDNCLKTNW